jgi:hypothetical protein
MRDIHSGIGASRPVLHDDWITHTGQLALLRFYLKDIPIGAVQNCNCYSGTGASRPVLPVDWITDTGQLALLRFYLKDIPIGGCSKLQPLIAESAQAVRFFPSTG